MKLFDEFIQFGNELSQQKEEAFNLWSWLPSKQITEKYHGDYYSEFMPTVSDILFEANLYIQTLINPNNKESKETLERFNDCCPCGDYHSEGDKK